MYKKKGGLVKHMQKKHGYTSAKANAIIDGAAQDSGDDDKSEAGGPQPKRVRSA
jgi:hypothetical protein